MQDLKKDKMCTNDITIASINIAFIIPYCDLNIKIAYIHYKIHFMCFFKHPRIGCLIDEHWTHHTTGERLRRSSVVTTSLSTAYHLKTLLKCLFSRYVQDLEVITMSDETLILVVVASSMALHTK